MRKEKEEDAHIGCYLFELVIFLGMAHRACAQRALVLKTVMHGKAKGGIESGLITLTLKF